MNHICFQSMWYILFENGIISQREFWKLLYWQWIDSDGDNVFFAWKVEFLFQRWRYFKEKETESLRNIFIFEYKEVVFDKLYLFLLFFLFKLTITHVWYIVHHELLDKLDLFFQKKKKEKFHISYSLSWASWLLSQGGDVSASVEICIM